MATDKIQIYRAKKTIPKKLWLIIGAIILLGLGLAAAAYFVIPLFNSAKTNDENNTGTTSKYTPSTYDQASSIATSQGYAAGQKMLDDKLSATQSPAEQASIYTSKATIAMNDKKYDEALSFALKAEQIQPTKGTADLVAQVYELKNDKPNAIKYYKIVLGRFSNKDKITTPDDYSYYQSKLQELGG